MTYGPWEIVAANSSDEYSEAIFWMRENVPAFGYVTFPFYNAPELLRRRCHFNGGDEDWMTITNCKRVVGDWMPRWIETMDSCYEPDLYEFGEYVVIVGSHA